MNLTILILGLLLFLGVHSLRIVADGWRTVQLQRLGEGYWKGLYSLLSAIGLGLTVWGFGAARASAPLLWSSAPWSRDLVSLVTLPASILLLAAYVPGTRIKAWVGHPMVAGVALWAASHLLANGRLNDVLLFGGFLIWAVADFLSARRRDRVAGRIYPAIGGGLRDALAIVGGVALWWLFARYGHEWLVGIRPLA